MEYSIDQYGSSVSSEFSQSKPYSRCLLQFSTHNKKESDKSIEDSSPLNSHNFNIEECAYTCGISCNMNLYVLKYECIASFVLFPPII